MSDQLKKFLFEDQSARAQIVSIRDTWIEIQARHDYPPAVISLLGELVAASVLLASNLKFAGSLVLQIQGDGPIGLLVVECNASLGIRATVKLREDRPLPDKGDLQSLVNPGGQGRFAVILDMQDRLPGQQPYQGVVALNGNTISEVLEHYMQASEQLQTRLWLAADAERAAGLLIQKLPKHGGKAVASTDDEEEDTYGRVVTLAETLTTDELLAESADTIIRRLFWQETLQQFEPQPVTYHCTCSRERIADLLLRLGQAEINDILAEQGKVSVNCDYCVKTYDFDAVDCAELFAQDSSALRHSSASKH
ncbi:MAG: Hsp33 family molecular chaperone HslO [Pigmentiphaga sp.]|nr:Hsp33 family molecular chaperone HslO [Pigmentiphaga sp.]